MAVPLFFARCLAPANPLEERIDLTRCAVRRLAMREMPDAGEHREIEICKRLAHAIGPRIGEQRIMLGPAHAGRHLDRRKPRCFTLHHPDATSMGRAVMRKAASEIAGLE